MGKHLVDIDEEALAGARAQLGTLTIRATVNEALARAGVGRAAVVERSLDTLGAVDFGDRSQTWR